MVKVICTSLLNFAFKDYFGSIKVFTVGMFILWKSANTTN